MFKVLFFQPNHGAGRVFKALFNHESSALRLFHNAMGRHVPDGANPSKIVEANEEIVRWDNGEWIMLIDMR